MKTFYCDGCGRPVFFENVQCLNCGRTLGYLQDADRLAALEPDGDHWHSLSGTPYQMCQNYSAENVCNWMIPLNEVEDEGLCQACRLNDTIPDLSHPDNRLLWSRIETAKRRLVYTLKWLKLPLENKEDDPDKGLAFAFLADPDPDFAKDEHVMTGHANGLITLNIAEADDAVREKTRLDLNERYRTLLGHFRHEVGHYYWDRLVRDSAQLAACRALFGDETADYGEALKRHYEQGPAADWADNYISTYASSHPWEDWAETWAHYLHMIDTLETAADFGIKLHPPENPQREVEPAPALPTAAKSAFDTMLDDWFALTFAVNSINRSMGLKDLYPFVLSAPVIAKLRFVHELIAEAARVSP